jgi:hypothetical protein
MPVYYPEAAVAGWTLGDDAATAPARSDVAPVVQESIGQTKLVMPDSPVAACRPVPFGYHCDWPSPQGGASATPPNPTVAEGG